MFFPASKNKLFVCLDKTKEKKKNFNLKNMLKYESKSKLCWYVFHNLRDARTPKSLRNKWPAYVSQLWEKASAGLLSNHWNLAKAKHEESLCHSSCWIRTWNLKLMDPLTKIPKEASCLKLKCFIWFWNARFIFNLYP